jgi:hypothetical protein
MVNQQGNVENAGQRLRVGVIGVGYLGRFHALKYVAQPEASLVAVVDTNATRAAESAAECHTLALTDYRELFDQVDCVRYLMTPEMRLLPSTKRTSPGSSDCRNAAGSLGVKGSSPRTGFSR